MSTYTLDRKSSPATIVLDGDGDGVIALRSFLRGYSKSKLEDRSLERIGMDPKSNEVRIAWEHRNLDTGSPVAGGFTLGMDFPRIFVQKLREQDAIYAAATIVKDVEGSQDLPIPYADDSDNEGSHHTGEIFSDNGISVTDEPTFSQAAQLFANRFYSSGIISVSNRLLRSSMAEQIVAELLSVRIGRLSGRHHAIGDGSGGVPLGLFPSITETVESDSPAGVTVNDISTLMMALDTPYRARASFVMASQTFADLVELRGGDGNQLLPIEWGPVPRLHRHPVILTDFAPAATAGNRSIVFADVSKYLIREVGALHLYRYLEGTINSLTGETVHFAEKNCTGFQSQLYSDAAWTDSNAGVALLQKSS